MNVIPEGCLQRLTPDDFDLLCQVLAPRGLERRVLDALADDPESLDPLLGSDEVLRTILQRPELLGISPELYFYVLVRHALRDAGISGIRLIDYVASALAIYARENPLRAGEQAAGRDFTYQVDFLEAKDMAGSYERFYLCVFAGNQFLVLTGLFPRFLRAREHRKGAPALHFYEGVARDAFHSASRHPLADEFNLRPVFAELVECFPHARRALNRMADEYLVLAS